MPAAHARLHVGDLGESQLADWLATAARDRAQRASLRNVRLLHGLMSQLGVVGPEARKIAERLVGAELVCPLGGEYMWSAAAEADGEIVAGSWRSSGWSDEPGELVSAIDLPQPAVLTWCKGLDADLTQEFGGVSVQASLLLHRAAEEPKFEFSPLKFFSSKKSKKAAPAKDSD